MSVDRNALRQLMSRDILDFVIRVGLIIVAVVACERIFAPFLPIMTWALILAVSFYPLHEMGKQRLGLGDGRAATLLVLLVLLLIGVPTVLLGSSFATHVFDVVGQFRDHSIEIAAPKEAVRDWPLIGEQAYEAWMLAHTDLPALLEQLQPQLAQFTRAAMASAAGTAGTLLFFFGAMIIAGVMMAYGREGSASLARIFRRIAGTGRGEELHRLATLTIRSVALGVVGVAAIQAVLLGIGFLFAGIPAAGLLALVVLVLGILQLPALLVSLPVVAYLWGVADHGTVMNIVLTVYLLVAGAADNVLKPMLLGRGVNVPMPVVLLGALGGMVGAGIIGLFIGAVVLSLGYELFMEWVAMDPDDTAEASGTEAGSSVPTAD
ncbi:MAG: AI-2E family transporter [Halieaceae bacterium]|jgi:predicted PurR-regulated permease PerM|nr:AI-2E family transporter [Halieaceae bacterium]